jgi:hypothetical protein
MATYLLTWNPEYWPWNNQAEMADDVARGREVVDNWSAGGTKQIEKDDRLFLLRQGLEPRGIIGSGRAIGDWYERPHFMPERAAAGDVTTFVDIRFDRLVNISTHPEQVLPTSLLNALLPALKTDIQRSGTLIDSDLAKALGQLWNPGRRSKELKRTDRFPSGITRDDVISAIAWCEEHGKPPTFEDSRAFDLIYNGKHYPPKVIAGLAARRLRGRLMFSQEFRGGENTSCFQVLESIGFAPVPKTAGAPATDRPIPFRVGDAYRREDVQRLLGLEPERGGNWATRHHRHDDDTFIFATLDEPGTTGHEYDNYWEGDEFHWETKGTMDQSSPSVRAMVNPPNDGRVYIFTRERQRDLFTYEGTGRVALIEGNRPVKIVWHFAEETEVQTITSPGEVLAPERFTEGATRLVAVNVYERNPRARRACIAHYGPRCSACGFDFEATYGDIGRGFIHVHHLKPLCDIDEEYEVDPLQDLRPVCPNCHAMLHTAIPPRTIDELRERCRKLD